MTRSLVRCALVALTLAVGCSKSDDKPAPAARPAAIPPAELQRGVDACQAYVQAVCTCAETVAAAKEPCALAKSLPEAIDIAKRLATNPQAAAEDAQQAADSIRKTVKNCIEQTAKLPALGC